MAVRAGRDGTGDAGLARGHLDALGDVAARFAASPTAARWPAFLAYLAAAEEEERGLAPGEVEVVEGAVQILTAHAAKGLEWDVVAVAGLSRGGWPGPGPQAPTTGWAGSGVLPFPLRGDADGLPELDLAEAADQRGVAGAVADFDRGLAGPRRARGAPAGVRGGDPPPPAAALLRVLVGRGRRSGRAARRCSCDEVRDACLAGGRALVDEWAPEPRRTRPTRPPRWCCAPSGRPTRSGRAGRR